MDGYHFREELTDDQHKALVDCCLGAHQEVWYKFKRFEDLSLLNLYYYQHRLVLWDKKVFGDFSGHNAGDPRFSTQPLEDYAWVEMRECLKGYQEALQLFKQTQQLKRPSFDDRKRTLKVLKRCMKEDHYLHGHDALGMLDMSPSALGVKSDGIRAKLEVLGEQWTRRETSARDRNGTYQLPEAYHNEQYRRRADYDHNHNLNHDDDLDQETPGARLVRFTRMTKLPDEEQGFKKYSFAGRPYQVPENPAWDRIIQLVVAIIAAATLLAPLITLSYIRQRDYTIMASCLFVIVFACLVSMISKASTMEVMVSVATYAAVLVVFVGQTIAPPS